MEDNMKSRIAKVSGYFIDEVINETVRETKEKFEDISPIYQHLHITTKDVELDDDDPIFKKKCDLADCERFFTHDKTLEKLMKSRPVKAGEVYRHFKGNLVKVIAVAQMSESPGSFEVIYQYGENPTNIWSRPYNMFVSPTDKNKYPDATQYFRFEKVEE